MEPEEYEAVMPFELNGRAIQLILKSVSFHLSLYRFTLRNGQVVIQLNNRN